MHSFTGFTSVLLLASAQRSYEDCSDDVSTNKKYDIRIKNLDKTNIPTPKFS